MPKKKKRKISLIKKDLWKLVARSIKERDQYTCWKCQKKDNGSNVHCSHILPKGEYPRYEFEEWNLKTLCLHCHIQWWHKNPIQAANWFKKKHLSRYVYAMKMAIDYDNKKPYSREELLSKIKEYEGPIIW